MWILLRGNPASDIDKAKLIESCDGDTEEKVIVLSALKNKHLQKMFDDGFK